MPTVIKQTAKQVKAAYRKSDGRPSESEAQRLEKLAADDRRAEEAREKEKKRKENKRKREQKEQREREARRKNGIGDATQACGWNFTQRRQKNWFRSYLQKTNPPPKPENPYRSSPPEQSEGSGDEHDRPDSTRLDNEELRKACPNTLGAVDHNSSSCVTKSIATDAFKIAEELLVPGAESAFDHESADQSCLGEGVSISHDGLHQAHDELIEEPIEQPDVGVSLNSSPWDADDADDDALLEAYNQAVEGVKSASDAIPGEDNEPWELEDLDEESLLKAVQGKTPVSRAASQPRPFDDNDLPSMDAALNVESPSEELASCNLRAPASLSGRFSDSLLSSSSDFDICAEDLLEADVLRHCAPDTPSKSVAMNDAASIAHSNPWELMPPPPKPIGKRLIEHSAEKAMPTVKQRKTLTRKCVSTENNMLPPLLPNPERSPSRHSRFAHFGLSTQLLADAAFEDIDL